MKPSHRRELKQQQEAREIGGAEMKRRIDGIMDYHRQLLDLTPTQLARVFDQSMSDPTIVKQKSLSGNNDSVDKSSIYETFKQAFDVHQIKTHQWRKYSDQPYIVHPIRVALLSIKIAQAMGVPVTPELIRTALAHDVTEDSPKFNGTGRLYKQQNLETLSRSLFRRKRGKVLAADAYALSHHDVLDEKGYVNEQKYFEKIVDGDTEAVLRRKIVKAADRLDNLLDPRAMNDALEKTRKNYPARNKFLDAMDRVVMESQDTLAPINNDLHEPARGTEAEKLRQKRIEYIEETIAPQGVISSLFKDEKFLDHLIVEAVFASVNTIANEDYNEDNLPEYIKNKRLTHVDEPGDVYARVIYPQSKPSKPWTPHVSEPMPRISENPGELVKFGIPRRLLRKLPVPIVNVSNEVVFLAPLTETYPRQRVEMDDPLIFHDGVWINPEPHKPTKFRTYHQAEKTLDEYLKEKAAA